MGSTVDHPTSTVDTLEIPLGVGIYDSNDVAFLNQHVGEKDVIAARIPHLDLLDDVEIGQRMLVLGPRDMQDTDVASSIVKARAKGAALLGYNLETALPVEELLDKEQEMQAAAREQGLLYAFAPTLAKLMRHHDEFARHANIIILQAQRLQTADDYEEQVEALIAKIKAANPEVKVWVQVSVNPPEKRDITADEVVEDIRLVADKADLVWIFFAPRRASVMQEVFARLR